MNHMGTHTVGIRSNCAHPQMRGSSGVSVPPPWIAVICIPWPTYNCLGDVSSCSMKKEIRGKWMNVDCTAACYLVNPLPLAVIITSITILVAASLFSSFHSTYYCVNLLSLFVYYLSFHHNTSFMVWWAMSGWITSFWGVCNSILTHYKHLISTFWKFTR